MTNTTGYITQEILARHLTDSLIDAKVVVYDKHSSHYSPRVSEIYRHYNIG